MTWRFPQRPNRGRPERTANDDARSVTGPWVDVGSLDDLRHNRLVVDLADGTSVLVVWAGRALAAVENECPHLGQRLSDGEVSGRVIQCAGHGYRWDLGTGQPVQGPRGQRRRPLRAVPVRLADHRIMLAVDAGPTPY